MLFSRTATSTTSTSNCSHHDEEEDTFFDCISHASDNDTTEDDEHEIALFRDGMCVYADGRPAFVPPGNCISRIPEDYLDYCGADNHAGALQMWRASQQFRREQEIWKIFRRPDLRFHHAKRYYPSCYHGICKEGVVLEYSFPGRMDPDALLPNQEATKELLNHHVFMQEYVSTRLYTDHKSWQSLGREPRQIHDIRDRLELINIVIDVKGADISLFRADVFSFLKSMIDRSTSHYPAMANACLVINAPFWVSGVFATIKPLLPDSLSVEIVSEANTLATLRKYVDEDQIPVEYGGSCPYPLHQHPLELRLHEVAKEAAAGGRVAASHQAPARDRLMPEMCSTFSSSGSGSSCCTSDFDDDVNDNQLPVKTNSLCSGLPLSNALSSREPTFFVDGDFHGDLDLTPEPPKNFWTGLGRGFRGCRGLNCR